jgi:hypothetical protein
VWPKRDAICLDCRSVVTGRCPAGPHRVQRISDAEGREALVSEVWGPKSLRLRALQAARAGAIGSGSVSLLDACSGCDLPLDGESFVGILVVFAVIGVLWFAIKLVGDLLRRRKRRLAANGARRRGLQIGPATGRIGTIISRDVATAPLGTRCVAFSTQLMQRSTVMLRDAATIGFEVLLDTGEHVRVPAGVCAIDMTRAPRIEAIDGYLRLIDPLRVNGEDFDPFPHDRAVGRILVPGDRVEVLGRLIPTADGAAGGGYRELAHTVLIPDELPRLRLVNESGRAGR